MIYKVDQITYYWVHHNSFYSTYYIQYVRIILKVFFRNFMPKKQVGGIIICHILYNASVNHSSSRTVPWRISPTQLLQDGASLVFLWRVSSYNAGLLIFSLMEIFVEKHFLPDLCCCRYQCESQMIFSPQLISFEEISSFLYMRSCAGQKDSGPVGLLNTQAWNVEKSENVHIYSCCDVICVILIVCVSLTTMCVLVIYSVFKIWDFNQQQDLGKPSWK